MKLEPKIYSTDQLLKILDSSLNAIMAFSSVRDNQGVIVDFTWQLVNQQAADSVGRKPEELIGKRLLEEMPQNKELGLFERYCTVVDEDQPIAFEIQYTGENINNWFQIQAVKLNDGFVVTFIDITESKNVEAELTRQKHLLSETHDLANTGSWSWDLASNQVSWSDHIFKMYEISDNDFEPSFDFFMQSMVRDDREATKEIIENAIFNNQGYHLKYRVKVGDQLKHLEARAIPRFNEEHKVVGYIGLIRDITLEQVQASALKKADLRAKRIQKVVSSERMAKSIAHEIRNPLTNIGLATEQLKVDEDKESHELFLDMIQRNGERIEDLIRKLMDSASQATMQLGSYDINEILDQVLTLAKDRIRLRNVKISKHYHPEMCEISVDAEKVKMALLNILINAVEAVDDGGEVKLATWLTDEECFVEISDNGPGIEPELQNHLFDPFFTGKKKGLGLGLTTTLNIINSHDANIEVSSTLGEGSTFIISFKR